MTITTDGAATTTASPDPCPSWCSLGPRCEGEHASAYAEIELSLGKPYPSGAGMCPDHVGVCTWADPRCPAPVVTVRHVDHYLPSMTPAEARQAARALIEAARLAEAGSAPAGGEEPSWCVDGPHRTDGEVHVGASHEVPVLQHWWCSHRSEKTEAGWHYCTADQVISAYLIQDDDTAAPSVGLRHAEDVLPHMALDAAEELALAILDLAGQARARAA